MYDVVVKKFTFAISSHDEFLVITADLCKKIYLDTVKYPAALKCYDRIPPRTARLVVVVSS